MSSEDSKYYEFNVSMSCGGCSGAIDRSLSKWRLGDSKTGPLAIEEKVVDLETQTVKVKAPASLPYDDIYNRIAGTGKTINSGKEVESL